MAGANSTGYCECGCGERTNIAKLTNNKTGMVAGQPKRFIFGHQHRNRPSLADVFWANVCKSDGCWDWTGAKSREGYGSIKRRPRQLGAHRVSWELANGPIPIGLWVLHKCDRPSCVRPDHLFLGTPADNAQDMIRKGRHGKGAPKGEAHMRSKLSADDVRLIRASSETRRALAKRYKVSGQIIYNARAGKSWRHLL